MKRKDVKLLTSEITNQLDDLSEVEVPVRKAPHFLAPHEARELMHTALLTDERCNLLPFFIFHCFLGCRPSELLGVSWKDVKLEDANEPFVLIPERVTGKNIHEIQPLTNHPVQSIFYEPSMMRKLTDRPVCVFKTRQILNFLKKILPS